MGHQYLTAHHDKDLSANFDADCPQATCVNDGTSQRLPVDATTRGRGKVVYTEVRVSHKVFLY